jgi:hypothetical protein
MRALILPDRRPATYWCTLDFAESSLAEDTTQHKHLHLFLMGDGSIGAFPNNRILWDDPAFCKPTESKPDFTSLWGEFRAEGVPGGRYPSAVAGTSTALTKRTSLTASGVPAAEHASRNASPRSRRPSLKAAN